MKLFLSLIVFGLLLCAQTGCSKSVKRLDRYDRNPVNVQKAMDLASKGDKAGAIALYKEVLDSNPLLARVHLDLGILLHDYEKDYVGAIYHYRRYLELRPATEKNELIQGRIDEAVEAFVRQNFKGEIKDLARPRQPEAAPPVVTLPQGGDTKPKVRTYVVKANDTLSSIAAEFYRDASAWKKIRDANASALDSSGRLKIGQTLVIP